MARPRTRPAGAKTVLSFQVEDSLVEALDAAADEMTRTRPPGSAKVTRSEVVKVALSHWLTARSKTRQ
jgi:predicted transcriptional regulator